MPDSNPTWAKMQVQLYKIVGRLEKLETRVTGGVRTELEKIKESVTKVAESEPGERNIGPGNRRPVDPG